MQTAIEAVTASESTGTSPYSTSSSGFAFRWNNAVLTALMIVGTGGVANPQMISFIPSGAQIVPVLQVSDGDVHSGHLADTQEKLAGIRRYLSMNLTDLAGALRVGRPTVYAWLRDEPKLRPVHAQRLEMLYRLAREWRAVSNKPVGEFLNRPLSSGATLQHLMSAKTLNNPGIRAGFTEVQEAIRQRPRRVSVVDTAKRRGFNLRAERAINWSSNEDVDI